MTKNYKRIGEYIRLIDLRNKGLQVKQLLGLSISKQFIPSIVNIVGTDMENYKINSQKSICLKSNKIQSTKIRKKVRGYF